jgi:ATP-binding cassette subfamily B protein
MLFTVAVPFFAGKVLAGIAQHSDNLSHYLVLLGAFSLVGMLCNRVGFATACRLQAKTMTDLNLAVFTRLLDRSVGFHANRVSGKLVSDALDFVSSFGDLINAVLVNGLPFLLSVITGLTIVIWVAWPLGLFLLFVVVVTVIWTYAALKRRSALRIHRLAASKKVTAHLADSIVNAPTVKTFGQEQPELYRNRQLSLDLERLRIHDWQTIGRSGNNRMGVLLLMQLAMILLIIHLTRSDPAMLGAGIFAYTYTFMITTRLFDINAIWRVIDESMLRAAPMTAVFGEKVEIQDMPGAKQLNVADGAIELQDVRFAYAENERNAVFSGLNLSVRPGERIGLVGPSGGGKSTLTRLLLRFDDLQGGSIKIDGQNVAEITQNSLRESIAYVPQEPLLFHRSVGDNISYGRPDAQQTDVVEAARKAKADEFIVNLVDGYDTIVGERGVKLSGGQRQRVAIARAILKDAPILVLDEATSSLDSESEVLIQQALWELMKGRTAIVIAHRLSTIQRMDRIIVLEDGKITEEGTHKQLLKQSGTYAKLWAHQSGGFIEE